MHNQETHFYICTQSSANIQKTGQINALAVECHNLSNKVMQMNESAVIWIVRNVLNKAQHEPYIYQSYCEISKAGAIYFCGIYTSTWHPANLRFSLSLWTLISPVSRLSGKKAILHFIFFRLSPTQIRNPVYPAYLTWRDALQTGSNRMHARMAPV